MKIINRARRSGKTTMMINTAYITGYPIVVYDKARATFVEQQAREMGMENIDVYTFNEFISHHMNNPKILIDEAKEFMGIAFSNLFNGAEIVACTMSIPCESGANNKEENHEQG